MIHCVNILQSLKLKIKPIINSPLHLRTPTKNMCACNTYSLMLDKFSCRNNQLLNKASELSRRNRKTCIAPLFTIQRRVFHIVFSSLLHLSRDSILWCCWHNWRLKAQGNRRLVAGVSLETVIPTGV